MPKALPASIPSSLVFDAVAHLLLELNTSYIITYYKKFFNMDVRRYFLDIPRIGLYVCEQTGLREFYPKVVGAEQLYRELEKFNWYYLEDKEEYSQAKKFITESMNVLEVGCGRGAFAKYISKAQYHGLEFNTLAVAGCKQQGISVSTDTLATFSHAHAGDYDAICAFQVLEHIPTTSDFITDCLRVLKKGGLFIFSIPAFDSFVQCVPNYVLNMPPHHCTQWPDATLLSLEKYFSLELIEMHSFALQKMHIQFYSTSMAGFMACEQLNIDHTLTTPAQYKEIEELIPIYKNTIMERIEQKKSSVRGHDVMCVFKKR